MLQNTQEIFSGAIAADGTRTGQALTATAISTNQIDRTGNLSLFTPPALEDEGLVGEQVWLIVQALAAANGADAAKTVTVTLESALDAALSSAPVVHFQSAAITGAQITAGATLVRVPLPSADYKKFIGLRYTLSAAFTSFPVWAFLTMDPPQRNVTYPTSFTVDV